MVKKSKLKVQCIEIHSTFSVRLTVQTADRRPSTENRRTPNPFRYTNWHGL